MFESFDWNAFAFVLGIGLGHTLRKWRERVKLQKFLARIIDQVDAKRR